MRRDEENIAKNKHAKVKIPRLPNFKIDISFRVRNGSTETPIMKNKIKR
jgi:hypothetical protein